ncbi:YdeI/OmpD-associated family protein [Rhizorhabdus argentea]|uniref:YdeI/OmpD-associated family protein n=1 Tax=Rhizorhabdus argentea TaxID=1387174 RepID=UPI0030EB2FEB
MEADPRIDAYIARAAPFAQPILSHVRAIVAQACPDGEETLKWGSPSIVYQGKILCTMAAFKTHATFGFWQGRLVTGQATGEREATAMGQFGRLTSLTDLPDDASLAAMVAKAMALIDSGVPMPRPVKHAKPPAEVPEDLAVALAAAPKAAATFESFPPGQRREYIEWIIGAKRAETRQKRVETTIAQLMEGKRLNWKYDRC